jgi:hypothetical protein
VGSFFAIHFVANLLVTVAAVLYSCESSGFYAMFLFIYLGVSVVGVNILCHRCVQNHTLLTLIFTLTLNPIDCAFLFWARDPRFYSRYLTEKAEVMLTL